MDDSDSFYASRCSSSESSDFERPYDWDLLVQEASAIDSKNAHIWSNSLIDRFHWLDPLFDNDRINFQKTGYALDHCVKLYCARIDFVANAAIQLFNSVNINVNKKTRKQPAEFEQDSDVEEESDDEALHSRQLQQRHKKSCTLAPNFDAIRNKIRNENTFISPLFYSKQSQFKEGSAKTLFLNLLMLDSNGTKIFYGDDVLLNEKVSLKEEKRREEIQQEIDLREANVAQINLRRVYRKFFQKKGDLDIKYLSICPSLPYLESLVNGASIQPREYTRIIRQKTPDVDLFEDSTYERISFDMDFENSDDAEADTKPLETVLNVLETQNILNYENSNHIENEESPAEHWRIQNIKGAIEGEEGESQFSVVPKQRKNERIRKPRVLIDFLTNDDDPFNEAEIFKEGGPQSKIPLDKYLANCNELTEFNGQTDQDMFAKMFFRETVPLFNDEDCDETFYDNDYCDIPDYHDSNSVSFSDIGRNEEIIQENEPIQSITYFTYSKFSTYVNFLELKNTMDECLLASFSSQEKDGITGQVSSDYQLPDSFNEISHEVMDIFENDTQLNLGKPTKATCFLALLSLANDYRLQLDPTKYHDDVVIRFQQN